MAITGTPTFGPATNITEALAASTASAGAIPSPCVLPTGSGQARTLSTTAGLANSCSKKADGVIVLAASGTSTIDLRAFTKADGTTVSLSVCHGFHIENAAAAEGGVNYNLTAAAAASNGFTAGAKLPTTGMTVEPASPLCAGNFNIAGWTVDATHKGVTFTAGSAGCTVYFCFFGD